MANWSLLHTPLLWRISSSTYNTASLIDKIHKMFYKMSASTMTALLSSELIIRYYSCPTAPQWCQTSLFTDCNQSLSPILHPTTIKSPAGSKTENGQLQQDRPHSLNTSQPSKTGQYIQFTFSLYNQMWSTIWHHHRMPSLPATIWQHVRNQSLAKHKAK